MTFPSIAWREEKSRCLPNLHVASRNGLDVGMVQRPANNSTDKNAWRCYAGIGNGARLIGHRWNITQAKACVERGAQ